MQRNTFAKSGTFGQNNPRKILWNPEGILQSQSTSGDWTKDFSKGLLIYTNNGWCCFTVSSCHADLCSTVWFSDLFSFHQLLISGFRAKQHDLQLEATCGHICQISSLWYLQHWLWLHVIVRWPHLYSRHFVLFRYCGVKEDTHPWKKETWVLHADASILLWAANRTLSSSSNKWAMRKLQCRYYFDQIQNKLHHLISHFLNCGQINFPWLAHQASVAGDFSQRFSGR